MAHRILTATFAMGCVLPAVSLAGSPAATLGAQDSRGGDLLGLPFHDGGASSEGSTRSGPQAESSDGPDAIYGGGLIGDEVFPDTAALADQHGIFCTGTLIAPDLVLTAAHCLEEGAPPTRVLLEGGSGSGGETLRVDRVVAHPRGLSTYDVGLVFLRGEAETEPRPLALDCVAEEALVDGASVTLAGYGETEDPARTGQKNAVDTAIVDADCDELVRFDCINRVSPGGELVAGGGGKDTCYGDSGGPLYLHTSGGTFLAGVTSRGATWEDDCGGGGIYVRPDAVIDWIEEQAGSELPRPDCTGSFEPDLDSGPDATPDSLTADANGSAMVGGCHESSLQSVGAIALFLPALLGFRRRRHALEDRS